MISQGQTGASILEALPLEVGKHVFEEARKHIEQPEEYVMVSQFQKQVRCLRDSPACRQRGQGRKRSLYTAPSAGNAMPLCLVASWWPALSPWNLNMGGPCAPSGAPLFPAAGTMCGC